MLKSNLKTSISQIWVICHLLPFVRVGQYKKTAIYQMKCEPCYKRMGTVREGGDGEPAEGGGGGGGGVLTLELGRGMLLESFKYSTGHKKGFSYLVGNLVATNWPIEKALHAIGCNQKRTK